MTMYSIYDLATMGIIYADGDMGILITYNGSLTFNIWSQPRNGSFEEIDMWTAGDGDVKLYTTDQLWQYCAKHLKDTEDV